MQSSTPQAMLHMSLLLLLYWGLPKQHGTRACSETASTLMVNHNAAP
jgi:hypothetical protein